MFVLVVDFQSLSSGGFKECVCGGGGKLSMSSGVAGCVINYCFVIPTSPRNSAIHS